MTLRLRMGKSQTSAPIPYEWNPYNWFLVKFGTSLEDPEAFEKFLLSLQENPPDVLAGSGFVGQVPFDWGWRGAIMGRADPLLGNWTIEHADPDTFFGRLPPDHLKERIAKLKQYTSDLNSRGKVKRVMPYIDFGTQLFGRHNRPAGVPQSVWGFWEFYDHWEEYAKPIGGFDLGPKPPNPTIWLRKWHDPNAKQHPNIPDELKGLSFSYSPIKPSVYGPAYRYAVCLNTEGWRLWWRQVIQWVARAGYDGAFVDNAYFTNCWNEECQEGYREWLNENFSAEEVRRYFTTTTNNLLSDPSIEDWLQEVPGQWRTSYWGSYPAPTSPIFPDTDAYSGRYSCRIEGSGGSSVAFFSHAVQSVPADEGLRLTFFYKSQGAVQVKIVVEQAVAQPLEKVLDAADRWKPETVDFHTLPTPEGTVNFYLRFEVRGTGKVWLDNFWLGPTTTPSEARVELETPFGEPVRSWAAGTYWSHVANEKLGHLRKEARKVNPNFELFTNGFHAVNADYCLSEFALVPELDHYRKQQRKDVGFYPGVYQDPEQVGMPVVPEQIVVTNIFGYKYIHSRRRPNSFVYHMPMLEAPAGHYHNPDSVLLNLAEASAFGGGAGCDAANLRLNYFRYSEAQAEQIRRVEKRFWDFIRAHKRLYEGYYTHADVGIVFHDLPSEYIPKFIQITDLAKGLAGRGVLYEVLTEERCDEASFTRLGALIYQDVSRISESEAQAVRRYLEQGGLVIAAGIVGDDDEWFRMRLPDSERAFPPVGLPPIVRDRPRPAPLRLSVGAGTLIYQPDPLTVDAVIAAMEEHLGRSVQLVGGVGREAVERLRLNAWVRSEGGGRVVLHVVNYDVPLGVDEGGQVQPLNDVKVQVPLPPKVKVRSVKLHSPEVGIASEAPVQFSRTVGGLVTFGISRLRIYSVAVIE